MKRLVVHAICTAAMMMAPAVVARAEVPFTVSIDRPDRTLDTAAFTTFEIYVTNDTGDSIRVRAARITNDLPDTSWYSSICSMTTCYPPEIDVTELESAAPRARTGFTVHIITGHIYGDTARIILRIDTGPGTDSVVREMTIATSPPVRPIFRVETQTIERSVPVGAVAEFIVWAYNMAGDSLSLSMIRAQDYYTSAGWESTICIEDSCAPPDIDSLGAVRIDVDRATYYKLRVRPGAPGQGKIVLRFNTLRGTEPAELRFTVNAGAAGIHERKTVRVRAYPNPANNLIHIPLPDIGSWSDALHVEVTRIDGVRMPNLSASIVAVSAREHLREALLDVSALASGIYTYRFDNGDSMLSGLFSVAR